MAEKAEAGEPSARRVGRLFAPRDIAGLALIRIGLGLVLFYEGIFRIVSGELESYYTQSLFRFSYPGFGWLPGIDRPTGEALCVAMSILGLLMAAGLFYRIAGVLYLLISGFFLVYDRTIFINHFYLIWLIVLLMICTPAHRSWSIASWWRPSSRRDSAPAWCWWVIRFQVGLVYFFAGVVKLRPDWLQARPAIFMWEAAAHRLEFLEPLPSIPMAYALAYGGLFVDLFAVPLLLWRRTRLATFLVVSTFHFGNAVLFSGSGFRVVGAFPWLMIVLTTAYFDPEWPRRWIARFGKPRTAPVSSGVKAAGMPALTGPRKAWVAVLAVYAVIQLFLPIRLLAYPGNAIWTREGGTFAWHMMSHHRFGMVTFEVIHPESGEVWNISPTTELTRDQIAGLVGSPSLILEYARHLAERLERAGYPGCEVRAKTRVSLNGRPPQPFIDPEVDLASAEAVWGHHPWVLPLEHPLPPLEEAVEAYLESFAEIRGGKER